MKKQAKKVESKKATALPKALKVKKDLDKGSCKEWTEKTNALLEELAAAKVNSLSHCDDDEKGCGCGGHGGSTSSGAKTDLIVLIDTSGSMGTSANAISDAVSVAIEEAKNSCNPDLEITFLGVDGIWPGTVFTQSHRDYIVGLHGTVPLAGDRPPSGYSTELGANAIEDLSKYAKWRKDACRAIFYISDEELDGSSPRNDFAQETAETNAAIASANANNVTVFAHHLTYQNLHVNILENYKDLCHDTGGEVYFSSTPNMEEYIKLLTEVICNACGVDRCKEADLSKIEPCISIKWGDSDCDCIESSDYEVMTITVCNCFTNLKFSNFKISMIEVLDTDGNAVPTLPNGTPSVKIHPIGVYCFGDIEPCSCVSREFVIINEGAKEGKYQIKLRGVCFGITKMEETEACFSFTICKD
ncbi:hypothetical protein Aeqsu_2559 [Aequorivita sublithincola DSM 14238]|uniref:VWFA domain-containing protein n=1 Tax=Aequorivita sublithincola (strain DSM 14238 / LMG 21431 / ACAM 643 / 9-3) TaxID=746697 RepID=I3YYE6_AEQSU|nr:hypothetical protein [Aequorivita sublithincola]AFL82014.1 hypothetical protein Aeqsu_2559 [Aequorivita sublithincola DSM 14238]